MEVIIMRKLIDNMLDSLNDRQLKIVYQFLKGILDL